MSSVDHVRNLDQIDVPNAAPNGQRFYTTADNNKRTEQFPVRISGLVTVSTGIGGGTLRNRGSILSQIGNIGLVADGADRIVLDARLNRFIADCMAPSPLPAVRLTQAQAAAPGAYQLSEICPIWCSAPQTVNMDETKFVEINKQLAIRPFITVNRNIAAFGGGTLAGTITNLSASVNQVYDDLVGSKPWLVPYVSTLEIDVLAANANLKIDMRSNRFMRGFFIQQDSDQGEVTGIINSLIFRGDSQSVIGDQGIPFEDLRQASAEQFGGELPPGYFGWNFARYGRLTTMWNPYQDTNARLSLNVAPLGGGITGDKIRVTMVEYERTAATALNLPAGLIG